MAFTPLFGTGFEMGSIEIVPAGQRFLVYLQSSIVHTGTYACEIRGVHGSVDGYLDLNVDTVTAELYIGAWVSPEKDYYFEIKVKTSDGYYVGLRYDNANNVWDAYVNGAKVDDGGVIHTQDTWHFVELYVNIDNAGDIQSKVDGVPDIVYSGDTQPGAATDIVYLRFLQHHEAFGTEYTRIDDLTYGTGGFPGDIRYSAALVPDGDTAQLDWTPSAGSTNYAMVDEIPGSDADYVTADTVGYQDIYTLSDWSPASGDDPQFIIDWIRAKKDTAATQGLEPVVDVNGSQSSGGSLDLSTTYLYYGRVVADDPDTGSGWDEAGINAIKVGQTYV